MAIDLRIPAIGNTIDEVYLVEWLVEENELVAAGQDLFRIESDKSTVDVVAAVDGRIAILAAPGASYPPGHVVARIG